MKKKILAVVIAGLCIIAVLYYVTANKNNNKSVSEFKVMSAFADVDMDMVIQSKDSKDDDTSADYIFIKFTGAVSDNKKNDDSNPVYLKSYTLDNNSLPLDTKIVIKDKSEIIIRLKDGALKELNSPHSLTISKNLIDKQGNKIKGQLNLKLPYSDSITKTDDSKNKSSNGGSKNNSSSANTDSNSANKDTSGKDASSRDSSLPQYTIELGKAIPYVTVVMVKLDTPNPENYKISIEGNELSLKDNNEGQKIFIGSIKKIYELDQVQKLIKIEKAK